MCRLSHMRYRVKRGSMRIELDTSASQAKALDALAKVEKRSRASIVREAINEYLARRRERVRDDSWGDRRVDGLYYQKKVRAPW